MWHSETLRSTGVPSASVNVTVRLGTRSPVPDVMGYERVDYAAVYEKADGGLSTRAVRSANDWNVTEPMDDHCFAVYARIGLIPFSAADRNQLSPFAHFAPFRGDPFLESHPNPPRV